MQIFVEDLDGRTRTLDVAAEATAADIVGDGKLLHNGRIITGSLRGANVQKDATLRIVACLRGGVEREYNSSDEDSVTTDSNEGKDEDESNRALTARHRASNERRPIMEAHAIMVVDAFQRLAWIRLDRL